MEESTEENDKIWYFAFGSNMNPKVLSGRRKVYPTQSIPASVPGWYLNFDTSGLPYLEPSFASIGKKQILKDQPEVHGVLHQITPEDYQQILKTEGGAGHKNVGGYASQEISAVSYDGQELSAFTLVQEPRAKKIYHGQFWPSRRYVGLIEAGSVEFGLTPEYQKWLKTVPRYEPPNTWRHRIGKVLYLSLIFTIGFPIILPMLARRFAKYESPRWVSVAVNGLVVLAGNIYYFIFFPIFGSGAGESSLDRRHLQQQLNEVKTNNNDIKHKTN